MLPFNPISSWFVPKTFGYGWTPVTWEGWLVTAIAAATLVLMVPLVRRYLQ